MFNVYDTYPADRVASDINRMERELICARESLNKRKDDELRYTCTQCGFNNIIKSVVRDHVIQCHDVLGGLAHIYFTETYC